MTDSLFNGLVLKSTGNMYEVLSEMGNIVNCRLQGRFRLKDIKNTNPVVVGDKIVFGMENDNTGTIVEIKQRKNYIDRKSTKLSKINHLIAANIDMAVLIVTLKEPRTSQGFIDRFLVACEGFRIPAILVFNKIDIYNEIEKSKVLELAKLYQKISYPAILTSITTNEGLNSLKEIIKDKIILISGHSGVGKSAIISKLFPNLNLKTGEISHYHLKGKHTTTFTQMFKIEDNTFVIDSPGIKEFGLIQYSKYEIRDYFPEIRALNNQCKFNNCLHLTEPGCAIHNALEKGTVSMSRYNNYLSILEDDNLKIADWKLE